MTILQISAIIKEESSTRSLASPKVNENNLMDMKLYQQYLEKYIREAIANSNGTNVGIYEFLTSITIGKHFVAHRDEKIRALRDAKQAFEEHRHWPRTIILSQLGLKIDE